MALSDAERKEGLPECSFWRCAAIDPQVLSSTNMMYKLMVTQCFILGQTYLFDYLSLLQSPFVGQALPDQRVERLVDNITIWI